MCQLCEALKGSKVEIRQAGSLEEIFDMIRGIVQQESRGKAEISAEIWEAAKGLREDMASKLQKVDTYVTDIGTSLPTPFGMQRVKVASDVEVSVYYYDRDLFEVHQMPNGTYTVEDVFGDGQRSGTAEKFFNSREKCPCVACQTFGNVLDFHLHHEVRQTAEDHKPEEAPVNA